MKKSVTVLRNISLFVLASSFFFSSCSKDKDVAPANSFAGQYLVVDDNETYVLKIENKGGNNFQIIEFGGFLNAPLKAVAEGKTLTIPTQTFTNPNGNKLTIVGIGALTTKNSKDDTINFDYTVSGFANYEGDFSGTRK